MRQSAWGWSLLKSSYIENTGRLQLSRAEEVSTVLNKTKWINKDMKERKTCFIIASSSPIWRRKKGKKEKGKSQVVLLKKSSKSHDLFCWERQTETERARISTGTCFMWLDLFSPLLSLSLSLRLHWHLAPISSGRTQQYCSLLNRCHVEMTQLHTFSGCY